MTEDVLDRLGIAERHLSPAARREWKYIADRLHNRIRRVESDGTIRTVAGTGTAMDWSDPDSPYGDGALPNAALLDRPESIDISGGGGMVIGDSGHGRVRAADPALPGLDEVDGATFAVPASDGERVYVFDAAGRHTRTVDGLTGTTLFTFGYTNGLVSSVTDKHGLQTTINRSASGALTSIVAATGQTTSFVLDSRGYLTKATDPAGKVWSFGYAAGADQAPGLVPAATRPDRILVRRGGTLGAADPPMGSGAVRWALSSGSPQRWTPRPRSGSGGATTMPEAMTIGSYLSFIWPPSDRPLWRSRSCLPGSPQARHGRS